MIEVGPWRAVADYHTHTRYSRRTHARGSVEDNVRVALERGLSEVGITDHGPAGFWYGLETADRFFELEEEVWRVRRKYPQIRIVLGLEANLVSMEGDIDATPEMIERMELLLVGFHPHIRARSTRDLIKLVGKNSAAAAFPVLARLMPELRRENTRALVRAVERHPVDIVTHPGLRIDIDTRELARACAANNTRLEINAGHRNTTLEFIRIAREEGAGFVLSSDAHRPEDVGSLEWAMELAQRAELTLEDVVNVEPVSQSRDGVQESVETCRKLL